MKLSQMGNTKQGISMNAISDKYSLSISAACFCPFRKLLHLLRGTCQVSRRLKPPLKGSDHIMPIVLR